MTNESAGHSHREEAHGEDWEKVYDEEQVWSGQPNDTLVAVMGDRLAGLPPGRAVDVGCGEGADAVWLAQQGWRVTALDVSAAALARGRAAAQSAGVHVEWLQSALLDAPLGEGEYQFVSVFYPVLRRSQESLIEALLSSLVAPGGALLVVHHAHFDREKAAAHGFDPDEYVQPDDVLAYLGERPDAEAWHVERFETERHVSEGRGAEHTSDVALLARRR